MTVPGFNATDFLMRLRAQDAALVGAGFPPISAWFWLTFTRFFTARATNAMLRTLVLRVGRRGGKSSTFCRLAVAWALHGCWAVPPGDVGVIAFVSVTRDEASQRLRTIEAILRALKVPHRRTSEGVELERLPVVFKTYVASTQGVIGFTALALFCDEVAAWRDADTGANPASEVLAMLTPTTASQPWAFRILSSAPRSTQDAHFETFERGDTDDQQVAEAPTWLANPTIAEAQTHALEPDTRIWRREYAAIPQPSVLGAFDPDAIDLSFVARAEAGEKCQRVMIIDASSGRKDAWTWCIAGWVITPRPHNRYHRPTPIRPYLAIDLVDGIEGRFWQQLSGDRVVERVAAAAHQHGVRVVHGDQRESLMLQSAFARHKLTYRVHDWTAATKPEAVEQVRRWFAERMIALPEHRKLRRELLAFEERVTPSGAFTFGARGGGHDDYVSLLVTLAMAEQEREIPGSPVNARGRTGGFRIQGI